MRKPANMILATFDLRARNAAGSVRNVARIGHSSGMGNRCPASMTALEFHQIASQLARGMGTNALVIMIEASWAAVAIVSGGDFTAGYPRT